MKTLVRIAAASILCGTAAAQAADAPGAGALDGRWDAVLLNNGPPVAFRLDIAGSGPTLKATFYDGSRPYDATTSATFEGGQLVLKADHYLTTITAALKQGELSGTTTLRGPSYFVKYDFHAVRHVDAPAVTGAVPAIGGSWVIPLDTPSSKGEHAFRFVVQQHGADVEASILRIDGDTGAYSGTYRDGRWVLSHFDGQRPGVLEISANADGTLAVIGHNEAIYSAILGGGDKDKDASKGYGDESRAAVLTPHYVAYRQELAQAKGLPEPDGFLSHTRARNASEKFTFNFPDADGRPVSQDDPRFKGKVVLAIVTGTWCPNCHDEAQYLVQLDRKYRDKGLAIVALDFEEPEEQGSLVRERAFVKQYGVQYTYLIAGAPAQMWEKVPQLTNLNTWPATLFIGRDGTVRAVHSGFASPASGDYNRQLKEEFTTTIERLLAEKAQAPVAQNPSAVERALTTASLLAGEE
jgi:thiol-disulfide isomerase/thioredoxin